MLGILQHQHEEFHENLKDNSMNVVVGYGCCSAAGGGVGQQLRVQHHGDADRHTCAACLIMSLYLFSSSLGMDANATAATITAT